MVKTYAAFAALLFLLAVPASAQTSSSSGDLPILQLTPRRLHRLRLDHDRQTVRWMNFENRVLHVPDSTQRGFELALYYAVTHDAEKGREAVAWAASHPNKTRQRAIVEKWCADLLTGEQRSEWAGDAPEEENKPFGDSELTPNERAAFFLLSLNPQTFEHPPWQTHIKALALVADYPNLPNAQFLQGWVLENDQMIREGPGVGYEFFWADPYLPGVSFQNMDPWIYAHGSLYARTDWTSDACWIGITSSGVQQQGCPSGWETKPARFGHLSLVPMEDRCMELEAADRNGTIILWHLPPNATVTYKYEKKQMSSPTDAAGLFRAPTGLQGKVCVARSSQR